LSKALHSSAAPVNKQLIPAAGGEIKSNRTNRWSGVLSLLLYKLLKQSWGEWQVEVESVSVFPGWMLAARKERVSDGFMGGSGR